MIERSLTVTILIGMFLLPGASSADVICGTPRPLKPVRCICGKLLNPISEPVSGALVTVVQNGEEVAAVESGDDGKFQFPELKSGTYELAVTSDGFRPFHSAITARGPAKRCGRGLVIVLELGYPDNCGSYVLRR
jgi:Carboxypeptidase regulatory-like domain